MRYFLDITYRGTHYHGWQIQPNAHTVQEEIENALSKLLGTDTKIVGSGRTDTGVHALQQVAHFDAGSLDEAQLQYKLNSFLSKDIAINSVRAVDEKAHARFDATRRSYQYHIHSTKQPFRDGQSLYFRHALDLKAVNEGCDVFKSWTDFEAFSKVKTDVNNFDCEIQNMTWETHAKGHVFHVSANRFLRGMVRALVGTLLEIGTGKMTVSQLENVLKSQNRSEAGASVSPSGLYLSEVSYPSTIYIEA